MTNVVPHPALRRQELLASLGARPSPSAFLATLSIFAQETWDTSGLADLAQSIDWRCEADGASQLAMYLTQYQIAFSEPVKAPGSDAEIPLDPEAAARKKHVQLAANTIHAAILDDQEKVRKLAFMRAWPIAASVDSTLGEASPVKIIERHMQEVFRPTLPVTIERPAVLDEDSALISVLRRMADGLVKAFPESRESVVVAYFLASPYRDSPGIPISLLRETMEFAKPFKTLLFTRYTTCTYERLDPMPEGWQDIKWLFEYAKTPWELTRVVEACYELITGCAEGLFDSDADDVDATVGDFFDHVRIEQERLGGISFWDEDIANWKVHQLLMQCPQFRESRMDLHSHLCWIAQYFHEPGEPGFDEWEGLVMQARDEGYVRLAQALTGYKLIEDAALLDRLTDWPAFTRLVRALRSEAHYDILATAICVAAEVWRQKGKSLLAARLEPFIPASTTEDRPPVLHLIQGRTRVSRVECEICLTEHVGKENWLKCALESRNWLIEADQNWSDFNFRPIEENDRTDWSFPALQFGKAIENELVLRFVSLCREAGDCNKGPDRAVTLGQIIRFHRMALKGDPQRLALLKQTIYVPLPTAVVKYLSRFQEKYRNTSAHPKPFDKATLDTLRYELFSDGRLRQILDALPKVEDIPGG